MREAKLIKYKVALLQLGLSQRQLADILGMAESTISMLLSGKRKNELFDKWMKTNAPELFKREYNKQ